jgi:hypothetical protein
MIDCPNVSSFPTSAYTALMALGHIFVQKDTENNNLVLGNFSR